jgi:hypothetical protein
MHNILSLDGGGIRGVFTLRVLARMEALLREHFRRPDMVLADYFDFIGGTSTGAIIGAALSWGVSVEKIIEFYHEQSLRAFADKTYIGRLWALYGADELTRILREFFSEDSAGEVPALLGTARLKTLFLCVMRNANTGSAWVITNSRTAKYNQLPPEESNLSIPLYQLIRASAAAPVFFLPEQIALGSGKWLFVDGAVTPYNNPSFIMYLAATLPCYGIGWPDGVDNLRLISVGTGRLRSRLEKTDATEVTVLDQIRHTVKALIDTTGVHQDLVCRTVGLCLCGEPIDSEAGDLVEIPGAGNAGKKFLYCRYNHEFSANEVGNLRLPSDPTAIDNLRAIPFYEEAGDAFASRHVRLEHLAG